MTNAESSLSVVIPTWNGRELLRGCLNSLRAQTCPARIIVVDNGSSDGTVEMLRDEYPSVLCHRLPRNQGFARAVNHGIRLAKTPFLALLNNDTEADAGWVEAGLKAFQAHPEFDFFACRMVNFFQRDRLDSAGDCYNRFGMPYKRGWGEPADHFSKAEPVLGASAGAAFYRRSLFEDVGLFDEGFYMYLEDVDFSLRCQIQRRRCLYLPEAMVYHVEAASDPERRLTDAGSRREGETTLVFYSATRVFWISRNRWLLMWLYQPWRHLPYLVLGWIRSGLFHLFKAGFFWPFARGVVSALLLTPRFTRKRLQARAVRQLSTGELCRLLREC